MKGNYWISFIHYKRRKYKMELYHVFGYAAVAIGLFVFFKLAGLLPEDPKIDTVKGASYEDYYIDDDGVVNYIKHIDTRV